MAPVTIHTNAVLETWGVIILRLDASAARKEWRVQLPSRGKGTTYDSTCEDEYLAKNSIFCRPRLCGLFPRHPCELEGSDRSKLRKRKKQIRDPLRWGNLGASAKLWQKSVSTKLYCQRLYIVQRILYSFLSIYVDRAEQEVAMLSDGSLSTLS